MKSSKKAGIIVLFVLGMSIFGYSQYASASQIGVSISQSELLNENEKGSNYNVELQFENPSLLILTAGETEFFVISNDEIIGKGNLESFTLQPLDNSYVKGTFHTDVNSDDEYVIPSTTTFTTWAGNGTANSYYKTTTTLGTSSGVRRYNADGTVDTSADNTTVNNYWQATRTTTTTPSDTSGDWTRVRVFSSYSTSATYYTYTDNKLNDYTKPTSGTEFLWQAKITYTNNAQEFGKYWKRGDLCGKRLSSCQCRYGFNPINPGTASSTGKAVKDSTKELPFGGFPGARKFK